MEKENFNADLPSADAPKYRKFKPPFSSGTTESPGAEALNRVVFGAPPLVRVYWSLRRPVETNFGAP